MEEWLGIMQGFGNKGMEQIGFLPFLGIMGISLFSALFISFMYVRFYKARSTGNQIYRAFPLLSLSITAIFITIQFSLPLSLGLLGALSIVRFRTPVKEPEEIGFIMLVVASALCCATFNMLFLSIILIIALIALYCVRFSGSFLELSQNQGVLVISVAVEKYATIENNISEALDSCFQMRRLDSIVEENGSVTVSYNITTIDEKKVFALQRALHALSPGITANIYCNNTDI